MLSQKTVRNFLLIFSLMSASAYGQQPISTTRYVAGGLLGSVVGFGLGHKIQGRWSRGGWLSGWGFTLADSINLINWAIYNSYYKTVDEDGWQPLTLLVIGGSRLAQMASIWTPPQQLTDSRQQIPVERYLLGGLFGSVVGFGGGHLIQGRYADAWPFAFTQVASIVAIVVELEARETERRRREESCRQNADDENFICKRGFNPIPPIGFITFAISKLAELVSLWAINPEQYQIASRLSLIPVPRGIALQLTQPL